VLLDLSVVTCDAMHKRGLCCRAVFVCLAVNHISLSGPSAHLIRICYLCHAATADLDKEVFPTLPLKSGMTYRFRSDSPLYSTYLSDESETKKTHYFANN